MPLLREGPHRCPVDFGVRVETRRHDVVRMAPRVDARRVVQLGVAEQLHVVGMDCPFVAGERAETLAGTDLVPGTGARVPLDGLAEGAGPGLLPTAALPGALAAQAAPEGTQAPGSDAGVASRPVDMQPGIGLVGRARQPRDHAADRAYQVAVPREGGLRRHRPGAAARAVGLGTRLEGQRNRRPIRPMERRVPAGGALRPAHHPVS